MGLAVIPSPITPGASPAINAPISPVPGAARAPSLRCPRCRHTLVPVREGELQCTRPHRAHTYPIVAGIPDLRTTRDADITVARERADAKFLAEKLARGDGPDEDLSLLAPDLADTTSATCIEALLNDWQGLDTDSTDPRVILDIGCGTGALLEAAARRWPVCVGVDISLRRLVLARHRLQKAGIRARLVCANMDALPFDDGLFDRVIAEQMLELAPLKERALREWNRMLGTPGRLWISTSNRWSVTRDPQLGIPALSWLPMQLLDVWAKWHGMSFQHRALVGPKRLHALLTETGYAYVTIGKPGDDPQRATSSRRTLRDLAVVRELAKRVRPVLMASAGIPRRIRRRVRYDRYMARQAL